MHELPIPAVDYVAPWPQPIDERMRMLARGRRHVAYYYESTHESSFRYRAYNMVQALNAADEGNIGASYFLRADLHRVDEIADRADALVICRSCYDSALAMLIARMRARRKPVYYDVDDLVFNADFVHLVMNIQGVDRCDPGAWQYWFTYTAGQGATLRRCDAAITTNDTLARHLHDYSGLPVEVVPNFMNREQLELSERIFAAKQRRAFTGDGSIDFGYFSGSPSHQLDLAVAESALVQLLEADPRVRLMLVGYIEPGRALARYGSRILRQPLHDYLNLQRLIASVEFNLMPLQSNVFSDCKSALKYFESAVVGTVSIASPSVNYAAAIRDGDNGYVARAHEWERKLEQALSQLAGYPAMAARARDDALQRYGWRSQHRAIVRALGWS